MNEYGGVGCQFLERIGALAFRRLVLNLRPALLQVGQLLATRLVERPGERCERQQACDEQTFHLIDSLEWLAI
ncbi:hypothetical protein D3C79_493110 [compost metagenome]